MVADTAARELAGDEHVVGFKIKVISLAACTALLVGYHARTKFGRDIRLVRVIVS